MKKIVIILAICLYAFIASAMDITFQWNANQEDDIVGYEIGYRLDGVEDYTIVEAGNVTQYTITGLDNNSRYFFNFRACDRGGLKGEWMEYEIDNLYPPVGEMMKIISIINNGGTVNIQ